jgi:hypothetical protein
LIRLAEAHPDWVLGYVDQVWWSRLQQPSLHTWGDAQPLRLIELTDHKSDPDPKALACYGLLRTDLNRVWLRFVEGRPVSAVTTEFLAWGCQRLQAEGKKAWLLVSRQRLLAYQRGRTSLDSAAQSPSQAERRSAPAGLSVADQESLAQPH